MRSLVKSILILSVFVCCGQWSSSVFAETEAFSFEQGFLYPVSLEGALGSELGGLFTNPSRIQGAKTFQSKVDTMQNFIGYNQLGFGLIIPERDFTIGFGYTSFYADDLTVNEINDIGRPESGASFDDRYSRWLLSLAYQAHPQLSVGVSGQIFMHELHDQIGTAYTLDFGALYRLNDNWSFGLYSRNLIQRSLEWDSEVVEDLPVRAVGEIQYDDDYFQVQAAYDAMKLRLRGEYIFAPNFSVFADTVYGDESLERYGFGTVLRYGQFRLQYTRLEFMISDLDQSRDLITVAYEWGGVVSNISDALRIRRRSRADSYLPNTHRNGVLYRD